MPEDATTPARPRSVARRIALWISNTFLILIVLLIAAHAIWTWHTSNALSHAIAEIEARGEPMSVAALQPVRPPGDQNGYVELKEAMQIVAKRTDASEAFDELPDGPDYPLRDTEHAVVVHFVAERASAGPLMDRAAAKPLCVMDVKLVAPLITPEVPEWKELRAVANWLRSDALLAFIAGDHSKAIRRLDQIELTATAASTHPSVIGHLVATGCRGVQANTISQIAPELRIGVERDVVSAGEAKRLIDSLLDQRDIDSEQLLAYRGERFAICDSMQNWWLVANAKDSGPSSPSSPPQKPSAFKRYVVSGAMASNAMAGIDAMTDLIAVLPSPDFPTAREQIDRWKVKHVPEKPWPTQMISSIMVSSMTRPPEAKYRILTDRHLAAAALAVRWYRVEHGGAWPGALEALVPKYLPAVPKDPMSAGGTIQYRAGDRPILWSVGTNGIDDGGNDTPARPRDRDWQLPDRVVHLTVQPR